MRMACRLFEIRSLSRPLICRPHLADGGPGVGLVFGFVQVADGQETVGVAVLVFGDEHPGGAEVLLDAFEAVRPGRPAAGEGAAAGGAFVLASAAHEQQSSHDCRWR